MLEVLNIVGAILAGLIGLAVIGIVAYAIACFAIMAHKKLKELRKD